MMKRKDLFTTIAFLLFILGFTSLTLSLVGIRWRFLSWIDDLSTLLGFLTKIGMIILAIILLSLVNTEREEDTDQNGIS